MIVLNVEDYFDSSLGLVVMNSPQALGVVMPQLLCHYFPNLHLFNANGIVGVIDSQTEITYKVFTYSGTKPNTKPSVMKGAGRSAIKIDIEDHFKYFHKYMLIDTSELPTLRIEIVEKE